MPALTPANIRALLPHHRVPDAQADLVVELVHAWLKGATGDPLLPFDYPDELWAAAVELAALVVSNPESLAQKSVGPSSRSWPLAARRDAILAGVREARSRARAAPAGVFPAPHAWPDPIVRRAAGWWSG